MSKNTSAVAENNVDAKSNFGAKGWMMVLYLFLGFFLQTSLASDLLNSIIPAFVAERGLESAAMYSAATVAGICYCFVIIILGFVVKKIGARALAIICTAVAMVSLLIWPAINSVTMFLILRCFTLGASSGLCYVANGSLTSNWFPKKKGLVMGWATIGASTSTIVAVAIFTFLYNHVGLAMPFYVWAGLYAVVLLMLIFFVRNYPEQKGYFPDNDKNMTSADAQKLLEEGLEYQRTSEWTIKKMFTTRHMWLIGFGTGPLLMFSVGVMSSFVGRAGELGIESNTAIALMSATAVVGAVASYLCGVIDTKIGTRKACMLLYAWIIVALLINLLGSVHIAFYYVSIVMLACAIGGANNFPVSMITTVFGRYDFSNAYRTTWPLIQIICSFGYTLVGGLSTKLGGSYSLSYILMAVISFIAIILCACISKEKVGR